ncbi:sister chromatid cohesion protein PDS5 homolog B-A isoform X1 [Salvelinus sp. IW2-2015]|uniref:sister chromatid cohesion protein PDS5 homolog B-A isoform X1 n=2 Tax=Salvelinus sp. IW2-2015 TaxID=2691554 RepID=UPI0038D3F103
MKSLAAQDDDSKPGRGRKRGAAAASQDDKAGQEAKPKRGWRKEPVANTGVGEEPWAETNAADTTLETKDEQNNPPKRGRRRRPPKAAAPNNDTLTKGMRGRKKAACQAEEEEEQGEEEDGSSENMEVKPTVQRGGRAPRRPQQRREASEATDDSAESTPQKRQGRPPKAQQHSAKKNLRTGRLSKENESEVEEMEMSQSQEEEDSKTTPKISDSSKKPALMTALHTLGFLSTSFMRTMTQHTSRLCKGYLTKESDGVLHQMTWPPE